MPERSFNSVKIFFADKDKVIGEVREYVRRVRQAHPEVEKVGLFGSYATDTYGPSSDVDLLIVLRESDKRFPDRIPDFLPDNLSVACDVFPYTQAEIEKMKQDENPWIRHVLQEVDWLEIPNTS